MSGRTDPATHSFVIVDSGSTANHRALFDRLPQHCKRNFNETLDEGARGIFIGGSGNYDLFIEPAYAEPGQVVPYFQIAGGVVHPICARKILRDKRYTTDAPNIVVEY